MSQYLSSSSGLRQSSSPPKQRIYPPPPIYTGIAPSANGGAGRITTSRYQQFQNSSSVSNWWYPGVENNKNSSKWLHGRARPSGQQQRKAKSAEDSGSESSRLYMNGVHKTLLPQPPRSYADVAASSEELDPVLLYEQSLAPSVASLMRQQLSTKNKDKNSKTQQLKDLSLAPPGGMPVDKWFASKFACPGRPAYQLFGDEFSALQEQSKRVTTMPPLLRPNRSGGARTIQSKVFTVNAHYVEGYKGRRYIACEGPNKSSVYDFWEMVWQEKVAAIVMLNQPYEERLNPKSYNAMHETIQYWPMTAGSEKEWAPWKIKCLWSKLKQTPDDRGQHTDEETDDYTYRLSKISLTENNPVLQSEPRPILHICHYKWPDGQIPKPLDEENDSATNALLLVDLLRKELRSVRGPIVVHCHAGVGRTGVAMVIDIGVSRLLDRRFADVRETVRKVREQRPRAVMNVWQYSYINIALAQMAEEEQMLPHETKTKNRNNTRAAIEECWRQMGEDMIECFADEEELLEEEEEEDEEEGDTVGT